MTTDELLARLEDVGSRHTEDQELRALEECVLSADQAKHLARIIRAADVLATHVDGLLNSGATSVPETTKRWLHNYHKVRDGDESTA